MERPEHATETAESRALKLWVVLSRAHAAVAEHVRADVARHDLTPAEFGVIEALYHKGPLRLGELQRKILVSSGGITYLVDRLAERGLVERRPCPEDRRASYAALTAAGEALVRKIFPEHARRLEHALSGLDESEQQEAIRLLRTLGHRAAELGAPSTPQDEGGERGRNGRERERERERERLRER